MRHFMVLSLKNLIFSTVLALSLGCGAKINKSPVSLYGSALLEQQCADNEVPKEAVTVELSALYA